MSDFIREADRMTNKVKSEMAEQRYLSIDSGQRGIGREVFMDVQPCPGTELVTKGNDFQGGLALTLKWHHFMN